MLLFYLHGIALVLHTISSALSFIIHIPEAYVNILSPQHTYLNKTVVLEHTAVGEQSPLVWVSVNETLTALSHLIAVVYLCPCRDPTGMVFKFEAWRRKWEYSATAGILQVALVLSVGPVMLQDIVFLLISNVALQWIGDLVDDSKFSRRLLIVGFLLLASQVYFVVLQTSDLRGSIDSGWITAMTIIYSISYIAFGALKAFQKMYSLGYKRTDEIYVLLSVTSKITLSWILIGNTFKRFQDLNIPVKHDDVNWASTQIWTTVLTWSAFIVSVFLLRRSSEAQYKDEFSKADAVSEDETANLVEPEAAYGKNLQY